MVLMRKLCKNWHFVANLTSSTFNCAVKHTLPHNYKLSFNFSVIFHLKILF